MKGNNLIVARVIIVVFIIPILVWAAVSRLFGELARVPVYIWSDWCEDAADAAHIWRNGTMPDKGDWE